MNSDLRIKSSLEFENIINNNQLKRNSFFVIYYKEKKLTNSRFGVTLSKNFGNAVKRNRYKRILREIIRTNQKKFSNNFDYIIIMKKSCADLDYQHIEKRLLELL